MAYILQYLLLQERGGDARLTSLPEKLIASVLYILICSTYIQLVGYIRVETLKESSLFYFLSYL